MIQGIALQRTTSKRSDFFFQTTISLRRAGRKAGEDGECKRSRDLLRLGLGDGRGRGGGERAGEAARRRRGRREPACSGGDGGRMSWGSGRVGTERREDPVAVAEAAAAQAERGGGGEGGERRRHRVRVRWGWCGEASGQRRREQAAAWQGLCEAEDNRLGERRPSDR